MMTEILVVVLIVALVSVSYIAYVFGKRLLSYDDVFQLLGDDIETNLLHFDKMRKSDLLSGDEMIITAHKNMMVMSVRLDEFINKMQEMTGKNIRKRTIPMKPINVTEEAERLTK